MSAKKQDQKQTYNFAPEILRAYDIRGEVGVNLGEEDAYYLGRAFASYLRRKNADRQNRFKVCVGYDGRLSSPGLAHNLAKGLVDSGVDVEDIGLGPTPMVYFAVKDRMADGGIMVTGSHNPASHNGFKLTAQSGPIFGDAVQELGEIAASGEFVDAGDIIGELRKYDIVETYVKRLLKDLTVSSEAGAGMKIAWDAGHGAAGAVLKALTDQLPGQHILLYEKVDGSFPAHHPDPTVDENLVDLQDVVRKERCHMGIAFDGDGDRIGVVDSQGNVLRGDVLVALYAKEILEETPGASIIGDVKCSQVLFDAVEKMGGKPVICATGHSIVKSKLNELKAPLAGELSGHIFFADKYYGFDDALYCGVRLLNLVGEAGMDHGLQGLTANIPATVNTPEIRIEVEESQKFGMIDRLKTYLEGVMQEGWSVLDLDGVRLTTPQGWLLIRASNTQNVLSMRVEGNSLAELDTLKAIVVDALRAVGLEDVEL